MDNSHRMPGWRPRQLAPLRPASAGWKPRLRFTRWRRALDEAGIALRAEQAEVDVVIRPACAGDRRGLERLGQLEDTTVTDARYVVAEIGGELVAAVPLDVGDALADPFRPTAELVTLLELRARQLGATAAAARLAA